MPKLSLNRLSRLALGISTALALTIAPCHVKIYGAARIVPTLAYADGGNGNGGNGNGGNGNGGNGNSGGNSSSGGGNSNNSGSNNSGNNNANRGNSANHNSHVNAATGDKIEIDGSTIKVTHLDGMKEEIQNGRFEMEDAFGRTIIEREATPEDVARLLAL
ncbi:hypothetical protein MesoLj131a_45140 [Mesorhizobium sp. 131-2-1]|nr:hypothetical protein MesoLj131a_45140 [Mesorhizobium sp. 131-2-1]